MCFSVPYNESTHEDKDEFYACSSNPTQTVSTVHVGAFSVEIIAIEATEQGLLHPKVSCNLMMPGRHNDLLWKPSNCPKLSTISQAWI